MDGLQSIMLPLNIRLQKHKNKYNKKKNVINMKNNMFRTLKAEEIEVRVQSVKNGKANMLLYVDSRAVTKLLDETVGPMNWQTEFYEVNGQTIGKLGIWDSEKQQWIWKSDTGTESNIEAVKGLISDVYKRMISRWGVVELYSSPKIVLDDDGYGNTGYRVSEILYDVERNITHLVLVNRFGKEVFRWDEGQRPQVTQVAQRAQAPQNVQTDALDYVVETEMDKLKRFYKSKFRTMSPEEQKIFTEFKDFYKAKIEKSGWTGNFDCEKLWNLWRNNNMKTQTK